MDVKFQTAIFIFHYKSICHQNQSLRFKKYTPKFFCICSWSLLVFSWPLYHIQGHFLGLSDFMNSFFSEYMGSWTTKKALEWLLLCRFGSHTNSFCKPWKDYYVLLTFLLEGLHRGQFLFRVMRERGGKKESIMSRSLDEAFLLLFRSHHWSKMPLGFKKIHFKIHPPTHGKGKKAFDQE